MARHFCMIDTLDTHEYRWVINISTRTNMEQVIAEGLFSDQPPEIREQLAARDSSDYIDRVWVWQDSPETQFMIHVESGNIRFLQPEQLFRPDATSMQLKEFEYRQMYDMFMDSEIMHTHQHVDLVQRRFSITNTHTREEYYNRHAHNRHMVVTKTRVHDRFTIKTSSRHCACDVQVLNADWSTYTGALIHESPHNRRDHLRHVIDL